MKWSKKLSLTLVIRLAMHCKSPLESWKTQTQKPNPFLAGEATGASPAFLSLLSHFETLISSSSFTELWAARRIPSPSRRA